MEKRLTQTERQAKKTAIIYLRGELKERLDYLNGEPDNLCKAYQAIIESMQNQLGERDIVKETHDFLDSGKIGVETLMQAFSFFSGMTQNEKNQIVKAYKSGEFDRHKGQNF